MAKARVRIASGCEPASRTAVPEKNYALAVELDKLLCGDQGVLPFLDNCGSVLSLDTVEDVLRFSPPEVDRESDKRWFRDNRDTIVQATRNLYFLLHPGGQFSDEKILEDIIEWAFQVLPPADVPETDGEMSEPRCRILCLSAHFFMHIATSRFSFIHCHCQTALSSEVSQTSKSGYFCAKLTGFQQSGHQTTQQNQLITHA